MANAATADLSQLKKNAFRYKWEGVINISLFCCAFLSVLVSFAIVAVLVTESSIFFANVSWREFFTTTTWAPLFEPRSFGVVPLITGTFVVAGIAGCFAMPLGVGIAIFLNEYAGKATQQILKPTLEILAGIPSVVFGYFAVVSITPALQNLWSNIEVFNALSAGLVVGIMILPLVASISDDALRAVPRSLKEGGYALGATKFEVIIAITIPAALSGIMASFILALARAIGETMAVAMAAGMTPNLSLNPFISMQTMTAYIAQASMGDTPHGTIEYQSIFAVGLVLFVITMITNFFATIVVKKYRKV